MLAIHNPATGELLGKVPVASIKNVAERARAARAAQPGWAALALTTRLEILQRFRAALAAEIEPLSITLTSEVGKPIRQSRNEINGALARIDFFLVETAATLAPRRLSAATLFQ